MEELSLANGGRRIKFSLNHVGNLEIFSGFPHEAMTTLSGALHELEISGAAPILPDGKVGGNVGCLLEYQGQYVLLASRSGKEAGHKLDTDEFCVVTEFNRESWGANFHSKSEEYNPTSDTPLLWFALVEAHKKFNWVKQPKVALHGHALAFHDGTLFPTSPVETLFSTPEDLQALEQLFATYSYPEHNIFIRLGHGFFLLADTVDEALILFRKNILANTK